MGTRKVIILSVLVLITATSFFLYQGYANNSKRQIVRIAHFPNITHAQALIGKANGRFQEVFGEEADLDWKVFNAGPSVIESIFAGELDLAYIGPSPAINGFVKSEGEALCVVTGAASGGASLVVRNDSGINTVDDFHGKRIASPQLGNTQDVSLRSWLKANGLKLKEVGGDVSVLPIMNADQLTLFLKKELDAAWSVEPWASILVHQADSRVFLDERSLWPDGKFATTVVIARKAFLKKNPKLVGKFIQAHTQITAWIQEHPEEAKAVVLEEIKKETRKEIPKEVMDRAWKNIEFTTDPLESTLKEQAKSAYLAGFLKKEPDLTGFVDAS